MPISEQKIAIIHQRYGDHFARSEGHLFQFLVSQVLVQKCDKVLYLPYGKLDWMTIPKGNTGLV